MSQLLKVFGVIASGLLAILILGFFVPSHAHIQRDILINATPSEVFGHISDFHDWEDWSPWAKIDPTAELTITGEGVGQVMEWHSDDANVGNGSQEIVELQAPTYLKTHLNFEEKGLGDAAFSLTSENGQTLVVWSLDTDMSEGVPFIFKPINNYLGLALDSLVGQQYDSGLRNLKIVVER